MNWSRRAFVGAGLVSAGAAAGVLIRKSQEQPGSRRDTNAGADVVYDVSEFETTDPRHLRFLPSGMVPTGLDRVTRLVTGPGGLLFVAGDRAVRILDQDGHRKAEIKLERPPHCLHLAGEDELLIGFGNHFEVFHLDGTSRLKSPRLGPETFLTAIGSLDGTVYLADAGSREVLMCDRRTGDVTGRFGRKDDPPGAPGFVVPSPYFDLKVDHDGLDIANPGRLRVERYRLDGRFESSWGRPGMAIDRFCGCCNPVYLARTSKGEFLTSEKGLARVNLYSATGSFLGAVAGPESLVDDKELARRACADCRLGGGFDVAAGEDGRVFVLDPFRKAVRIFAPITPTKA